MSTPDADLLLWQSRPLPNPILLHGQWVTLEPLSAEKHAESLWHAVEGHDAVWDWLGDGPYDSQAELAAGLHAKETGTAAVFFAILPRQSGIAEGYASLMRMDAANGVIEVGNVLFAPSLQRSAAATEAIYLLARYIFDTLGYRRFEWKCNAQSLPSRRAAERFGFVFEGVFRQHMVIKGRNRDTAWYAMLDKDWPKRRSAFECWLAPANFDGNGHQIRPLTSFSSEHGAS